MGRRPAARPVLYLPADPEGQAILELTDGGSLPLEGDGFAAYLLSGRPFALPCSFGAALVIPERRSRSSRRYWIARGYSGGRRVQAYVGEHPTAQSLRAAQTALEERMSAPEPPLSQPPGSVASNAAVVRALQEAAVILSGDGSPEKTAIAAELAAIAERLRAS